MGTTRAASVLVFVVVVFISACASQKAKDAPAPSGVSSPATETSQVAAALPISYETPKSWTLMHSGEQGGANVNIYEIKDDRIGDGADIPSNALITTYKLPEGISIANADSIVAERFSHANATTLVSAEDGEDWKTYLAVTQQDKRQVIFLYRIGMADGVGVEAMVSFPLVVVNKDEQFTVLTLDSTPKPESIVGLYCHPASVKKMVDQFNAFSSGLKISGMNTFKARAILADPPPDAQFFSKTK